MRILMLGWEFPPYIAGGLGTACHGLTRALDAMGHEVVFVLPRAVETVKPPPGAGEPGRDRDGHVRVLGPGSVGPAAMEAAGDAIRAAEHTPPAPVAPPALSDSGAVSTGTPGVGEHIERAHASEERGSFARTTFREVPAAFTSPYPQDDPAFTRGPGGASGGLGLPSAFLAQSEATAAFADLWRGVQAAMDAVRREQPQAARAPVRGEGLYGGDLFDASQRYARLVVALARRETFDVIHAHDWLTFPAGLALRAVARKPLVVHVHATEFDRAGANVNEEVYDIERAGVHGADRVIAVSELTRSILISRYGVDESRVEVVYNGIDRESLQPGPGSRIERDDKIVLFLGRLTAQKGPEYFIRAAKMVLEKEPSAKFVVAGSGDQGVAMVEQAAAAGIGSRVLFTGFLRGDDVRRVFAMADCYVMPSVSEPFGLAALEAMSAQTPVIVSKQSGVAEVLEHALKVDFWDVEEMANKIVAVLRHPPLRETLREHGSLEVHRLTWERAADQVVRSYHRAGVTVM